MTRLGSSLAILLVLAAAAPGPTTQPATQPTTRPAKEQVTIGGETFRLEPVVDEKSRARGLGGREKIEDHGGMLFVFPDARRRSFWMKDCVIDIDIMFLDNRGRITAVHKMKKQPPRGENESNYSYERRLKLYPSIRPARFAIELEAGSIDRLKPKPGQTITLDLPRLRKMAR